MAQPPENAAVDQVAGVADWASRFAAGPGLTVRSLQAFVAVARLGSMSAAARQLGLSQPAISQYVAALEAALGVVLFDRSTRPPVATMQASALLGPAQTVIDGLEQFARALRSGAAAQLPALRIGMINSCAVTLGPVLLANIRSLATKLTLDSGFHATRVQAVADRAFDMVITSDETPLPSGIAEMPILTEPLLIVVPASYRGDLQDVVALSRELELIRFGRDPFKTARFDQTLRGCGVTPASRYHLDTHEAVLRMVATGLGWTILPPLSVHAALRRNDPLRVAPFPETSMKRTVKVVFRQSEGAYLAEQVHKAASEALRELFLPEVPALFPGIAARIVLHAPPWKDAGLAQTA